MIRTIHSIDACGRHVVISDDSPYLHKINRYLLSHLQNGDRVWIKDDGKYLCCKVDQVTIDLASVPEIGPHYFIYRLTYSYSKKNGSGMNTRVIAMGCETDLYYIDILEVHKLLFPKQQLEVGR